ncbi:MAG: polysaccharide biosynthesis C-terminal domain-containing protein, partial [Bacteroidales bacterium]|nr:polysaccharide biosynthesis C-terminal domain-containing protein [Bacteroidales bacterium]
CLFFNREIMGLMYFEHIETSSIVLAILMVGFVGICITYIFGTLLTSNGSLKYLNIMAACGMVLNIILNFILIPHYGVIGAAISSMVTQLATGLCQYIIAFRLFKFNFNLKFTIVTTLFVIISVAASYFATMIDYNRWVVVCGVAVVCVLVAVALRVLDLHSALGMLKESLAKKREQ